MISSPGDTVNLVMLKQAHSPSLTLLTNENNIYKYIFVWQMHNKLTYREENESGKGILKRDFVLYSTSVSVYVCVYYTYVIYINIFTYYLCNEIFSVNNQKGK